MIWESAESEPWYYFQSIPTYLTTIPQPSTLQTDGRTDGRLAVAIHRCADLGAGLYNASVHVRPERYFILVWPAYRSNHCCIYSHIGRQSPTCAHCDAGFEHFVDVTPRNEFAARDSVHVAQREADEVVASCFTILPVSVFLDRRRRHR